MEWQSRESEKNEMMTFLGNFTIKIHSSDCILNSELCFNHIIILLIRTQHSHQHTLHTHTHKYKHTK